MKNFFYALIFFMSFIQYSFSEDVINQNISKLNNLYLNGILNKETYFSSLNKLGLDTNNDIFSNLFYLFENNTIETKEYEKSIINLISITSPNDLKKNNNLSNNFQFKINSCSGQTNVCAIFKERGLIEIELFEGKLKFSEDYKSNLLSHPGIAAIQKEEFKINDKNAKVSMTLTNAQANIFTLNIEGNFDSGIFIASKFNATSNGQIMLSGNLLHQK